MQLRRGNVRAILVSSRDDTHGILGTRIRERDRISVSVRKSSTRF